MAYRNKKKKSINSIFVLGSTSEIAYPILIRLADMGCKRFHLLCKDSSKNSKLIQTLESYSEVTITEEIIDLSNEGNSFRENRTIGFFDLYLVMAGYLGDNELAKTNIEEALRIIDINFRNLIPWINAIFTEERINQYSRLWVFSSVAAEFGRPSNYFYGSAKAALSTFLSGIYYSCYKKPFSVRIFHAGYIYTSMTINKAPKILCAKPNIIAKRILKDLNKRGIEYLPWWWLFIMKFIRLCPPFLISKL
tara:strand:+ start:120 stop:869 length:750 start_codon:yes stop_codon:yes gene_type:complete